MHKRSLSLFATGALAIAGHLVVVGCVVPGPPPAELTLCDEDDVERFGPYCVRLGALPDLPIALASASVTLLEDDALLVSGGHGPVDGLTQGTTLLLEHGAAEWLEVGSMPLPVAFHGTNLLPDGRVLATGGAFRSDPSTSQFGTSSYLQLFDPTTREWTIGSRLDEGRGGHVHVTLSTGEVLVAGGNSSTTYRETAELIAANGVDIEQVSPGLDSPTNLFAGSPLADGAALLTGGLYDDGTYVSRQAYVFSDGGMQRVGDMSTDRTGHSSVTLADGRVLVTGGWQRDEVDVFDPVEERFTAVRSLPQQRYGHQSVLLRDGSVMIVGSSGEGADVRSTSIYDVSTDEWHDGPTLASPHGWPRAFSFSDGSVVVVGGCLVTSSPESECTSSVERIELVRAPE